MKLFATRLERFSDEIRLVGTFARAGALQTEDAWFSFPPELESFVQPWADAFVPALLVPCLAAGEDLDIVPPISPLLRSHLPRAIEVLTSFHPAMRPVSVRSTARKADGRPPGPGIGTLFSGGVDSFYTLIKAQRDHTRVTHLVFIQGLEQPLDPSRRAEDTIQDLIEVADATGTRLLAGRTNLRLLFPVDYERYYHGAALASAGLALSRGLGQLLVPSAFSYGQLCPWGSHPLLDELWSSERLTIVHDACEARRIDKLRDVVRDPVALGHLRVCLESHDGPGNCGRCLKCVRTMLELSILGTLASARTFPRRPVAELERVCFRDGQAYLGELADIASAAGRTDLLEALRRASRRAGRRRALRELLANTPLLDRALAGADAVRRRARRALAPPDASGARAGRPIVS